MSKQATKKIVARIETLRTAASISRQNAKNAARAKFRKLAAAKAERLAARIANLKQKLAA